MSAIEAKVVEELNNKIGALKETIEKAGAKGRENLKLIDIEAARKPILDASGKFDENLWKSLGDKQQEVYDRLVMACELMREAASLDGPKNPNNIMFDEYASNRAIGWLTTISFGLMFLILGVIIWQWNQATGAAAIQNLVNEMDTAKKDLDTARKKVEEAKAAKQTKPDTAVVDKAEKNLQEAQKNLDLLATKLTNAEKKFIDQARQIEVLKSFAATFDTAKKDLDAAKKKVEEAKAAKQAGGDAAAVDKAEKNLQEAQKNLDLLDTKLIEAEKNLTDQARQTEAMKALVTELDTAKKDLDAAKKKVEEAKGAKQAGLDAASADKAEKNLQEAQKNLELLVTKEAAAEKKVCEALQRNATKGATEGSILFMVILLGALGGSIHLVNSMVKFVGNRQFKQSWILYYYAMPLTGAGLAPVIYLLLRVGIINPSGVSANVSSTENLNLMVIYVFAILTGMFSRAATDKLAEVFLTLFSTKAPPSKDALGSKGSASGSGAASGKTT
jgi:hypothetical protein